MPAVRTLILITGAEGAGKTTMMRALLPETPNGAKVDAEDVGQVNPFMFGDDFLRMLWANVAAVIDNFWAAGFATVITGSLLDGDRRASLDAFRRTLPEDVRLIVVHLRASRRERDRRREARDKPTTPELRDMVDANDADEDLAPRDGDRYRLVDVDTTGRSVDATVREIRESIPEVYSAR